MLNLITVYVIYSKMIECLTVTFNHSVSVMVMNIFFIMWF